MKNKIVKISICILLVIIIGGALYYCIVYDKNLVDPNNITTDSKFENITYKTNFFTRKYKVDNIQTILETDWNLLKETDQNKLTLITCIANKKLQRLCVQATEIVENNLK